MNKKTKISLLSILSLFSLAVVFSVGFLCGILFSTDPTCGPERKLSDRHEKIQLRTESYKPSCEELKNKGIPKLVRRGDDYFFVNIQTDYYHVFGINVDPSEPPVMFWWGAGLDSTLEQKCSGKTDNTED